MRRPSRNVTVVAESVECVGGRRSSPDMTMRRRDESSRRRIESMRVATSPRTRSSPSSPRPRSACRCRLPERLHPWCRCAGCSRRLLNVPPVPVVLCALSRSQGMFLEGSAGRHHFRLRRVPMTLEPSKCAQNGPLPVDADRCAARSVDSTATGSRTGSYVKPSPCIRRPACRLRAASPRSCIRVVDEGIWSSAGTFAGRMSIRRFVRSGAGWAVVSAAVAGPAEPINNDAATAAVADRLARSRRLMTSPIFSGAGERGRSYPCAKVR